MKQTITFLLLMLFLGSELLAQTISPGTRTNPAALVGAPNAPVPPILTLQDFLNLGINVKSASYSNGVWTFNGYYASGAYAGQFETNPVLLGEDDVLRVNTWRYFKTFSLVTIPLKVRGKTDTFSQNAQFGLTNAGIVYNLVNYRMTRYFSSGKQSLHQLAFGIFAAPSVEELAPETTKNFVNKKSKQLFVSTGLAVTYTYNDVTLALIPVGIDFATSEDGSHFIYNKKAWWGLGIGITAKIFGMP